MDCRVPRIFALNFGFQKRDSMEHIYKQGELKRAVVLGVEEMYGVQISENDVQLVETRKDFAGEQTVLIFPLVRHVKMNPETLAQAIGSYLKEQLDFVADFNAVKGFLNLEFTTGYWKGLLEWIGEQKRYGYKKPSRKKVLIEYSSPNTNKPLHLGHIRNILLGSAMVRLFESQGYALIPTQIINDRGIAICKSMVAWKKWGKGDLPGEGPTPLKGDHFVGKYYVLFEQNFKREYNAWQSTEEARKLFEEHAAGDAEEFFKQYKNEYFNRYSKLGREAVEMLQQWENGDLEVRALWQLMNSWVLSGISETYERLGAHFDKNYYESEVYSIGKAIVTKGLESGVFFRKEDGSVWANLEDIGMDQKIVLRSDGTSVYITQDLGTAALRYDDFKADRFIYVVADEQEYHFQVLFELLKRLGAPYAEGLHHLSYGMVELPEGKMKSREGKIVDADDLIEDVIALAKGESQDRGELQSMSLEEREAQYEMIGLGALKYFILKVNAKKRMIFNPKESVDLQGQTGPYIQNAFVRIKSLQRKDHDGSIEHRMDEYDAVAPQEKHLLLLLMAYPRVLEESTESYNPSNLAGYLYQLAKAFHKFYHDIRILSAETAAARGFRLQLSQSVARVLESGMNILGISMPERM